MANAKLVNERDYFGIYEDKNDFLDYDEDVFCDELEGYTFCPYTTQKGKKNPTARYKTQLRERFINLWSYSRGTYIRVPCLELPEEKRIFIAEANFNKFWEHICSVLLATKRDLDLSYLETETREAYIGTNYKIAYRGKTVDINKQRLISKRANASSNPKLRYVASTRGNVIHDKTCIETKQIKDENILFFEKFPERYELCPNCRRKIWVRMGIKEETKHFDLYYRFIMNMKLSDKQLRHLFENQGVAIHMDIEQSDRIDIKYREDNWYIRAISQGEYKLDRYELFHNNYGIIDNRERVIYSGYHRQKIEYKQPWEIFAYMGRYNWKVHLKKELEVIEAETVVEIRDAGNKQGFLEVVKSCLLGLYDVMQNMFKR